MSTSRRRLTVCSLVLASAGLLETRPAPAENRFFIPQVNVPEGSTGNKIYIHASADTAITAFSLNIRYDAAALRITEVTYQGTSVVDPDFWDGTYEAGSVVHGALLDLTVPFTRFLPPASDHTLACLQADALAAAPRDVTLWFDQTKELHDVKNVITDQEGNSITPLLESGLVRILAPGDLLPQANAGPDQVVPEVSPVTLDGSLSTSPLGNPLSFQWAQISGPPAQDAQGADSESFSFNVPPVTADVDLVFELTASDGESSSKDRVSVHAVDLESRQARLSRGSIKSPYLIDGGSRAVVLRGTMSWSSPYEDALWTRAKFHAGGRGDEARLLSGAALYFDANSNGLYDSGDYQAGETAPILEDDGSVEFVFYQPIDGSGSKGFFLVVSVAPEAQGLQGWGLAPLALALGGLLLARRVAPGVKTGGRARGNTGCEAGGGRGMLFLALCAALWLPLGLGLSACGGGGGGGGSSDPTREVSFSILDSSDLDIHGASTGVQVGAQNLPVTGPAVKV